jgi:hypothetical protein
MRKRPLTDSSTESPRCRRRPRRGKPAGESIEFRVPPSQSMPKRVFLSCRGCGYGPPTVPPGGVCPKCGGRSWERYARSVKLQPKTAKT